MTKKAIVKKESKMSNKLRISTCEECKGNPIGTPFSTPPHEGVRCVSCWEIISFQKITDKPKTNEIIQKEQEQVNTDLDDSESPFG